VKRAALAFNLAVALSLAFLVRGVYLASLRCPCPAPDEACQVPCSACCDVAGTPEVEPCPCDPTCDQ
jgi:hypothetical protein